MGGHRVEAEAGNYTGGRESASARGCSPRFRDDTSRINKQENIEVPKMTQEFELNDPLASFATFTKTMRHKIEVGTKKHGDFTKWGTRTLIESLWKQFEQLNSALIDGNSAKAEQECVDVANLAYMVAYSLKKRGVK